jgi:hypothetical protein
MTRGSISSRFPANRLVSAPASASGPGSRPAAKAAFSISEGFTPCPEFQRLCALRGHDVLAAGFAAIDEQRADHVTRDGVAGQCREFAGFYPQGLVHRFHGGAVEQAAQRRDRGRVVVAVFGTDFGRKALEQAADAHVVEARAAGNSESPAVPGLLSLLRCQYPLVGRFEQVIGVREPIDDPQLEGLLRVDAAPGQDQAGRRLQPDQARQSLGAAAAGQQAECDLRQSQPHFRVVEQNAVVAGKHQLQATPQCRTVYRHSHGLAAGLQLS